MKHVTSLGLAVVAAATLAVFASSAPATVLTSPAGVEYTGSLTWTLTESLRISTGFADHTCTGSTMAGGVENNTTTASGKLNSFSLSGCAFTADVLNLGFLGIASDGTVTGSGFEITFSTPQMGSCVYGFGSGTKLGHLSSGTTASLSLEAEIPKKNGGFLCSSPAKWTGKYTVTVPDTLLVD